MNKLKKIATAIASGGVLAASVAISADDPVKLPVFVDEPQKQIEQLQFAELEEVELFRALSNEALRAGVVDFSQDESFLYSLIEGVERLEFKRSFDLRGEKLSPDELQNLRTNFLQKFRKVE